MLADMRTKPCSGPIISRSIKWMTEFIFYTTSNIEHYQLMRSHEFSLERDRIHNFKEKFYLVSILEYNVFRIINIKENWIS